MKAFSPSTRCLDSWRSTRSSMAQQPAVSRRPGRMLWPRPDWRLVCVQHHPPQVHRRGTVRPSALERAPCTRVLLLLPFARVLIALECACVPACCWQFWEHAGAAEKGHSRVRHFPGVVTFPVAKRAARRVGCGRSPRARPDGRGPASRARSASVANGLLRVGARARASAAAHARCVNRTRAAFMRTHVHGGCMCVSRVVYDGELERGSLSVANVQWLRA